MIGFATLETGGVLQQESSFYSSVLGWTAQPQPDGSVLFLVQMPDRTSRPTARMEKATPGQPMGWLPFAMVPNVSATIATAQSAGGTLVEQGTYNGTAWAVIRSPSGEDLGITEQPPSPPPPG